MGNLPISGFWNWDHTTNWSNDANRVETGCFNKYTKHPDSFVEDFKRCMEYMNKLDLRYLILWGLFRDSHGGEKSAEKLLKIARKNNIKVLSGAGINCYGGFYYEGKHRFNMKTWLDKNPGLSSPKSGKEMKGFPNRIGLEIACPSKEENIKWHEQGIKWLLKNFDVAGVNLETGDYGICGCKECQKRAVERQSSISSEDMSYVLPRVIKSAYETRPDAVVTYATYGRFTPEMKINPPAYIKKVPKEAIAQWTISDMTGRVHSDWPASLKPPAPRNTAFSHWGSQWGMWKICNTRHYLILNHIKEICEKSFMSGMEGVFITGEINPTESFNWKINYEAFSYFRKNPEKSFSEFAKDRLPEIFGSKEEALKAVKYLTEQIEDKQIQARIKDAKSYIEKYKVNNPQLREAWTNVAYNLFVKTL